MDAATRRNLTVGLFAVAVVLAVVGLVLWDKASSDAENDRVTAQFTNAILNEDGSVARVSDNIDPNRTPAIAAFVVAGLALVSGVIVVSTTPRAASPSPGS
jgi:hypothetical protein